MIYDIFGFDFSIDFKIVQLVIYCALLGNLFRFLLSFVHNQYWTRSRLQFLNFSFLPCITFIITKIIAGNIALSLGMVGALSIVRFRTPIKNPVELLVYFLLIASGIVSYTNINLYVNFIGFCIVIIIFIALFKNYSKKTSFIPFKDENEEFSFLKLQTNKAVTLDNYSSSLFQTSFDGNSYIYRYRSNNSETLESIIAILEEKDIVSYSIDKSI